MKLVNPVYGNGLIYEDISTSNAGTRTAVTTSLYYHYDHLGSTTALTDASGQVTGRYSYGTYGEVLSGSREKTPYLYNGKLGVMTDENSLYYMRSRYYNVSIKRFMNRDTLRGDMSNSQSLNRYSYVQGNPVSYTDPFGTSPYADVSTFGHSLLNLLGMIPVAGDVCDLANMAWYLSEGNLKMAGACALSALPMMGTMAGGALNICKLSKAARYTRTIACTVGYGYTTFVATDATINHGKEAYRSYRETGFSKETSKAVAGFTISLACAVLSGKATVDNLSSTARMLSVDTGIRNSNLGLNNYGFVDFTGKGTYDMLEGGDFSETSYGKSSSNCTELVPYYPANNGAVPGTEKKIYLMAGDKIDRFGGKKGKFFSPTGTPMEMRALPYDADLSQYRQFEVVKSFEVEASMIAPAFGNIGLGTQYRSSVSVEVLLKKGIIKQVGGN